LANEQDQGGRRRQQQQEGENSSGAHFNSAAADEEAHEVLNKPGEEEVQLVQQETRPRKKFS
jgi:hypothetical protein